MPDNSKSIEAIEPFESEIERLKIENLLLKQKAEFDVEFRKHIENVDSQMDKGKVQLGVAGFVVLCIAGFGTYRELGGRVEKRLDKEFSTQEIRTLISQSADKAAREVIQKRITESTDAESNQLKCAVDRQGRDVFPLKCRAAGGQPDDSRGVCINASGEESFYKPIFPRVDCDKVSRIGAANLVLQSSSR